mmetsp:Transcript_1864/g.5569  ORF Transcript_1864/g.5569 Transcript_1864/m.5569 type:complete len:272 (-) Transcript_1864:284-1099(-)
MHVPKKAAWSFLWKRRRTSRPPARRSTTICSRSFGRNHELFAAESSGGRTQRTELSGMARSTPLEYSNKVARSSVSDATASMFRPDMAPGAAAPPAAASAEIAWWASSGSSRSCTFAPTNIERRKGFNKPCSNASWSAGRGRCSALGAAQSNCTWRKPEGTFNSTAGAKGCTSPSGIRGSMSKKPAPSRMWGPAPRRGSAAEGEPVTQIARHSSAHSKPSPWGSPSDKKSVFIGVCSEGWTRSSSECPKVMAQQLVRFHSRCASMYRTCCW